VNLEYSLSKEIILANQNGAYCNTTLVGCNTRKYHGLLIAPVQKIDGGRHVFLSTLHETLIQHEQEFNLGINKYPGEYSPKGHKYLRWFEMDPAVNMVYRVGGAVIQKEILLTQNESRLMIRYTLLEAHSPTKLRLKPFLAFRSIHKLSKENMFANTRSKLISNGIMSKLYDDYPALYMQTSRKSEFIIAPDWYNNIEYPKEKLRGYDYTEDLFVPGFFETSIRKGQSIVFTAGFSEQPTNQLTKSFKKIIDQTPDRNDFGAVLKTSADLFIQNRDKGLEIMSGYPWFGRWGRHSFIALPGLTVAAGRADLAPSLLKTMEKYRHGIQFPDHSADFTHPHYGSADNSLWFIWAIQELARTTGDLQKFFKDFSKSIFSIINGYHDGAMPGVEVNSQGMLHAYKENIALTWMDSYINGMPVTQRPGYAVEINALWYNAVCFALEGAELIGAKDFYNKYNHLPDGIAHEFQKLFWDVDRGYLADYIFEGVANWDVRPNQIFACSLPYSPLTEEQKEAVLDTVHQELLTPKGIRTLSPRSEFFKRTYEGDHNKRDQAYHQGTVWPWLLGHFAQGWLNLYGESGADFVSKMTEAFEDDMMEYGICMISEVYDGSPPHRACGAIAFASSVAELLRIKYLLSNL
ncbi:MAG: glycogen debranching enzyme family protein, partial [Bacteroidales bacterium]|nr:glycogen debranching enzyme family protein [Bacteroidales bacterium]